MGLAPAMMMMIRTEAIFLRIYPEKCLKEKYLLPSCRRILRVVMKLPLK